MQRRTFLRSALAAIGASASPYALAYDASKPIRLIVPFLAGGSTDIVARIIAPELSKVLDQPVNVDNVAGAGGTIGTRTMLRAPADGNTLCVATVSTTGTGPIVRRMIDYDPTFDLTPIFKIVDVPGVIAVHPAFPASDFDRFIAEVRAKPGVYEYGSSGSGGVGHMGMELFKIRNRIYLVHIPFRSARPAVTALLAGRVPVIWDNLSSSLPYIQSGQMRAIGLVGNVRSPQLPGLPTFAELGLTNYHAATYFGVLAPRGIPSRDVYALNGALNAVMRSDAVQSRLRAAGGVPVGGSPAVLQRQIHAELSKWGEVATYTKVAV